MFMQAISTAQVWYCLLEELDPDERRLIIEARKATDLSHSPYSNYCVGCAILLKQGTVITGANQENASYGLACCAERTTIFSINNMGLKRDIAMIAVTARPADAGASYVGKTPVAPCGACRQVIKESEDLAGTPIKILMDCFDNDRIAYVKGISSLLPFAFGPADLGLTI
jgi:cytidine deaminase